ncbi:Fe-only nitrogenase accessory AnfO family protein [Clostridium sp. DJ247]|uniref:Fe-only nitrogenase accessory AnfO family protein n=1 Tax=Clostridium sp. DJ247 TaxID=2726188 RepID=UPI001629B68B|nr:Fe-only nitrogenase accessory AnfO family protein [Clostridium sp. DJ247]MBC2581478.1 Fe-only nitrogenase accessory protein AnfO [Clostridium sp. DJ247]
MTKELAVVLNDNGQTETMYDSSIIKVYSKKETQWEVVNEFQFTLKNLTSVKSIRESILNLIKTLGEYKIIVAKELNGTPYTVLDMAGFTILEVEGAPEDFLDDALESIEEYQLSKLSAAKENETNIGPIPTNNEGCYYINLKDLEINNPGVSTKQALRPFLNNTTFYELTIICGHVPMWLEDDLKKLNMESTITKVNPGEYKITVCHKTCDKA